MGIMGKSWFSYIMIVSATLLGCIYLYSGGMDPQTTFVERLEFKGRFLLYLLGQKKSSEDFFFRKSLINNKARRILTLFTTFKNDSERFNIHRNVLKNWAKLKPWVQPVYFYQNTDPNLLRIAREEGWLVLNVPRVNAAGTPFIKDMFAAAKKHVSSSFYGFSNGDILYEYGSIKTLKAISNCLPILNRTLVVGRRINYEIKDQVLYEFEDVQYASNLGELFRNDAQDYFHIFNNDFPWDEISDVVIGRPGYDNYLVKMAMMKNVSVIDATNTIIALHQTGKDGNWAGHQNKDLNHNFDVIGNFDFKGGITTKALYETRFGYNGEILLYKRSVNGMETQICPKKIVTDHSADISPSLTPRLKTTSSGILKNFLTIKRMKISMQDS